MDALSDILDSAGDAISSGASDVADAASSAGDYLGNAANDAYQGVSNAVSGNFADTQLGQLLGATPSTPSGPGIASGDVSQISGGTAPTITSSPGNFTSGSGFNFGNTTSPTQNLINSVNQGLTVPNLSSTGSYLESPVQGLDQAAASAAGSNSSSSGLNWLQQLLGTGGNNSNNNGKSGSNGLSNNLGILGSALGLYSALANTTPKGATSAAQNAANAAQQSAHDQSINAGYEAALAAPKGTYTQPTLTPQQYQNMAFQTGNQPLVTYSAPAVTLPGITPAPTLAKGGMYADGGPVEDNDPIESFISRMAPSLADNPGMAVVNEKTYVEPIGKPHYASGGATVAPMAGMASMAQMAPFGSSTSRAAANNSNNSNWYVGDNDGTIQGGTTSAVPIQDSNTGYWYTGGGNYGFEPIYVPAGADVNTSIYNPEEAIGYGSGGGGLLQGLSGLGSVAATALTAAKGGLIKNRYDDGGQVSSSNPVDSGTVNDLISMLQAQQSPQQAMVQASQTPDTSFAQSLLNPQIYAQNAFNPYMSGRVTNNAPMAKGGKFNVKGMYAEGGQAMMNGYPVQPAAVQDMGSGRLYDGQGGGQDDTLDTGNAMLSPGEFVHRAEVVSALGDGNTDKGAAILNQMGANVLKGKAASVNKSKGKNIDKARPVTSYLPKSAVKKVKVV